jgi:hypothetical protein
LKVASKPPCAGRRSADAEFDARRVWIAAVRHQREDDYL